MNSRLPTSFREWVIDHHGHELDEAGLRSLTAGLGLGLAAAASPMTTTSSYGAEPAAKVKMAEPSPIIKQLLTHRYRPGAEWEQDLYYAAKTVSGEQIAAMADKAGTLRSLWDNLEFLQSSAKTEQVKDILKNWIAAVRYHEQEQENQARQQKETDKARAELAESEKALAQEMAKETSFGDYEMRFQARKASYWWNTNVSNGGNFTNPRNIPAQFKKYGSGWVKKLKEMAQEKNISQFEDVRANVATWLKEMERLSLQDQLERLTSIANTFAPGMDPSDKKTWEYINDQMVKRWGDYPHNRNFYKPEVYAPILKAKPAASQAKPPAAP